MKQENFQRIAREMGADVALSTAPVAGFRSATSGLYLTVEFPVGDDGALTMPGLSVIQILETLARATGK